jgi:hypothetical protein
MAERLLNEDCCSQVGGHWTNGTITVIDGNNSYTFTDSIGLSFAQSLGQNNYCSNCATTLKKFNSEIVIEPGAGLLNQECCEHYGFSYDITNYRCYACPNYTPATPNTDNINEVVVIPGENAYATLVSSYYPPNNPVPYLALLLNNSKDLSQACCNKINESTGLGYFYSLSDYDISYTDPTNPGYISTLQPGTKVERCYQCPPFLGYAGSYDSTKPELVDWGYTIVPVVPPDGYVQQTGFQPNYEIKYNNESIKNRDCCVQLNYYKDTIIANLPIPNSTIISVLYSLNPSNLTTMEKNGRCWIRIIS